jgi:hypothetical protein
MAVIRGIVSRKKSVIPILFINFRYLETVILRSPKDSAVRRACRYLRRTPYGAVKYVFSRRKAIPIGDTRQSPMRLPPVGIDVKWVAAPKPQALGMDANVGYHVGDSGIRHVVYQYPTVAGGRLNMYPAKAGIRFVMFILCNLFSAAYNSNWYYQDFPSSG